MATLGAVWEKQLRDITIGAKSFINSQEPSVIEVHKRSEAAIAKPLIAAWITGRERDDWLQWVAWGCIGSAQEYSRD